MALAIDLSMVMVARNQAQNAADLAAMTYARAIDGSAGGNLANAQVKDKAAATANRILNSPVLDSEVAFTPAEPLAAELRAFIESVESGARTITDGEHGLAVVQVLSMLGARSKRRSLEEMSIV